MEKIICWFLYNKTTGEIYGDPYRGYAEEYTNIPDGYNVIGPIPYDDVKAKEACHHPNYYTVVDGKLTRNPATDTALLVQAKEKQIAELGALCTAAIYKGFTSSTLGVPHQYKLDDEAQRNFSLVSRKFDKNKITEIKWTTKDAGPLLHTKVQFEQLDDDQAAFLSSMQEKYRGYKEKIQAAATPDEIKTIMNNLTW